MRRLMDRLQWPVNENGGFEMMAAFLGPVVGEMVVTRPFLMDLVQSLVRWEVGYVFLRAGRDRRSCRGKEHGFDRLVPTDYL